MITGSTQISLQQGIGTPVVNAYIKGGLYNPNIHLVNGSQQNTNPAMFGVSSASDLTYEGGDGTVFNNRYVFYPIAFEGSTQVSTVASYSIPGGSLVSDFNLGITHNNSIGNFLDTGSTLFFVYVGTSHTKINRLVSNNGTSWYGLTTLYTNSSAIRGLVQTSEDTLYILSETSFPTVSNLLRIKRDTTYGATIVVPLIFSKTSMVDGNSEDNDYTNFLQGARIDSNDRLLVIGGRHSVLNAKDVGFVYYEVDQNNNVFEEKTILGFESDNWFSFSNLAKGITFYYIALSNEPMSDRFGYYMYSKDLRNWTEPISLYNNIGGGLEAKLLLFAGKTEIYPKLVYADLFSNSLQRWEFYEGVTSYSLNGDIISYSNDNNERLKLTLANYK